MYQNQSVYHFKIQTLIYAEHNHIIKGKAKINLRM
jgi:hypothetical protein